MCRGGSHGAGHAVDQAAGERAGSGGGGGASDEASESDVYHGFLEWKEDQRESHTTQRPSPSSGLWNSSSLSLLRF
jgi:hypothetical protein